MHVYTLHWKELAAVRYQWQVLSVLSEAFISVLLGDPAGECMFVLCFNSYIRVALCIAEACDYQSHIKASVQPVFLDLAVPRFPNSSSPCSILVPCRHEWDSDVIVGKKQAYSSDPEEV